MENLAPILLFVYNRPDTTKKTIEALIKNELSKESELYIFSDAAKDTSQKKKVDEVRKIIHDVNGFKNVHLKIEEKNKGLANSIIDGVTKVAENQGKVIVLEDDLITSPWFLRYMNDTLNLYEDNSKIWSISGYSPAINFPEDYNNDLYLTGRACSWGWATWNSRWKLIDWDISNYSSFKKDKKQKKAFNRQGNDMSFMLRNQMKGYIDSWAIRWCYNQFLNNSLTIYPRYSYIENIGFKNSSTHGSLSRNFEVTLAKRYPIDLIVDEMQNPSIIKEFSAKYNLTWINYLGQLSREIGIYKLVKSFVKKIS
ncbi:glycosyltransferase [Domibacillus enclensis]|uniref:Glycosyl transferase family 2 n=1 Tax=Domibacillus enclensis TaxID=1017273 RepID=A0A1N6RPN0_9BACI|nr:glycosyltransferase [Domibacillus enclensis]OXS79114.1 sugar transferase [Domibacillus enclensis]SIQ30749.1 Glycosyl transferase family 2 [Domibacillus enclensis]